MSSLPGTVIGVKAVDGVVIAAEKRMTYDGFVLSKNTRKVFPITDHIGIGFAGLVGDMQFVVRALRMEAKNYELQNNREIKVKSLAKILSIILYSYKLIPLLTEIVVGGVDNKGPQIYVLDPVGSLIEDKYAALGSGGPVAIGIIEKEYRDDMNIDEVEKLVINAIRGAIERDAVSGDGLDILRITKDGYELKELLLKREALE
ncbi:MAG: archaeal proteasome endopeptidase complex subunit beta [Staphylothermus sp.]|nr:archaeal proteasome endopeptidase complex subunit beta [Staphylothermus sp.]